MTQKIETIAIPLVLIVVAAIAFGALIWTRSAPAGLDLSRDRLTVKGLYRVTIAPEAEPFDRAALHGWIATVSTPQGAPVEGAEISVDGGMPQHGHGLPTAPAVTASLGGGRYRIEGVRFNMGGMWEFKLRIKAAPGEDDVTFNLDL